ncbi:MAG: hypothetical protein AAF928_01440 [Myxococcota bacterium]
MSRRLASSTTLAVASAWCLATPASVALAQDEPPEVVSPSSAGSPATAAPPALAAETTDDARSTPPPADPPFPRRRQLFFEASVGGSVSTIFDAPVYTVGGRAVVGAYQPKTHWSFAGHLAYHGGATEHGLSVHRGGIGATATYHHGRLRVGISPEVGYHALKPFTGRRASLFGPDPYYGGFYLGAELSLGVDVLRAPEGTMFVEYRAGGRLDALVDNRNTWTPGSLWLGMRFGP